MIFFFRNDSGDENYIYIFMMLLCFRKSLDETFYFSGTPTITVSTAIRQASASHIIPFKETGSETASVVGEPRVLYPRDSNGEPCIIQQANKGD